MCDALWGSWHFANKMPEGATDICYSSKRGDTGSAAPSVTPLKRRATSPVTSDVGGIKIIKL